MRVVALAGSFVVGVLGCAFAQAARADTAPVVAPTAEHVRRAIAAIPDGAPVAPPYGGYGPYGPAPYGPPYGAPYGGPPYGGPYGGPYGPPCGVPCAPPPPPPCMGPCDPCCYPCPRWTFWIGGWAWGIDGTVGAQGRELSADSNWTDALDEWEIAFTARARVEWNRWSATFQVDGGTFEDAVDFHESGREVDAQVSLWTFQGDVGYTFFGGPLGCGPCAPVACVEGYVGFRSYWVDFDADPTASTVNNGVGESFEWTDPIVGARANLTVGPRWRFGLEGDIGGFGVGSDFAWSVTAFATFLFTDHLGVTLGWRVLDVDYEDGDLLFDARLSGPFAAFVVTF